MTPEDAVPNLSPSRTDRLTSPEHTTVVLVDREALYRWFVTESLQGCGIDVVPCRSLDEANAVLHAHGAADLLIVDADLLERDGGTLLALSQAGSMPCVVLESDVDRRRAGGGAMTFADKPVDADAVVRLVTGHLRGRLPAA